MQEFPEGHFPDGRTTEKYMLVNPDETRDDLKAQYEAQKDVLIGKQLVSIAECENLFDRSFQFCVNHSQLRGTKREDDGPEYDTLFSIMDELKLGMTPDEMDVQHNVL